MQRGPNKKRFEEIYKDGIRVSGKFCRLIASPGKGQIGFATAKSIGNRPRRNKARRRFVSALAQDPCIPAGLDVVIQINATGATAPFPDIREDLAAALRRISERWASELAST